MSSSVFFSINDAQSVQKRVSAILFPSIFQIPADTQFFVKSPQRRRDIFYISGRDVCLRKLLRARGTRRTLGECACVVLLIRSRTVSAHTQPHEIYIYGFEQIQAISDGNSDVSVDQEFSGVIGTGFSFPPTISLVLKEARKFRGDAVVKPNQLERWAYRNGEFLTTAHQCKNQPFPP